MKQKDKINLLKSDHFYEFISTREKVFNELSDKQTMFCVCGKLVTGLHERNCRKFNEKVNQEVCNRLEYLLQREGGDK